MMKYEVEIKEIAVYQIEVEADDEEEACNKAWDMLAEDEKTKALYFFDSDGEAQATEIE